MDVGIPGITQVLPQVLKVQGSPFGFPVYLYIVLC